MLTANHDGERKDGILVGYKVAAGVLIYKGALVCLNRAGYAVPATDDPGLKFVGIAYERGDNAAGYDGEVRTRVWKDGSFRVSMPGAKLADLGKTVFIVDDNTVTAGDRPIPQHGIPAGTIVEIPAEGVVRVLIRNAVR